MTFTHNKHPLKMTKRIPIEERKRRLIQLVRDHPDWDQTQLGLELGIDKSTVSRNLKVINDEFKVVNSEMWILSRERILKEIRENKAECMRRLKLCSKPHQGSRWMEEWSKLNFQESKILGVNSPSHVMIHEELTINKIEIDAGVNAALAQYEEPIIEIDKDGTVKLTNDETALPKRMRQRTIINDNGGEQVDADSA
jgi:hypothetical protein